MLKLSYITNKRHPIEFPISFLPHENVSPRDWANKQQSRVYFVSNNISHIDRLECRTVAGVEMFIIFSALIEEQHSQFARRAPKCYIPP